MAYLSVSIDGLRSANTLAHDGEAVMNGAPGTIRSDGKVMDGLWAFDGNPPHSPSTSLEDALLFVLRLLMPVREKIFAFTNDAHLIWWCGHFQSSFDGGYSLSAAALREIADFGVEFYADNYFFDECGAL